MGLGLGLGLGRVIVRIRNEISTPLRIRVGVRVKFRVTVTLLRHMGSKRTKEFKERFYSFTRSSPGARCGLGRTERT